MTSPLFYCEKLDRGMARPNFSSNTGLRNINLEEIWADLEEGIKQIYKREQKMAVPRYMQLYT